MNPKLSFAAYGRALGISVQIRTKGLTWMSFTTLVVQDVNTNIVSGLPCFHLMAQIRYHTIRRRAKRRLFPSACTRQPKLQWALRITNLDLLVLVFMVELEMLFGITRQCSGQSRASDAIRAQFADHEVRLLCEVLPDGRRAVRYG